MIVESIDETPMTEQQQLDRFVAAGYNRTEAKNLVKRDATISLSPEEAEAVLEQRAAQDLKRRGREAEIKAL